MKTNTKVAADVAAKKNLSFKELIAVQQGRKKIQFCIFPVFFANELDSCVLVKKI